MAVYARTGVDPQSRTGATRKPVRKPMRGIAWQCINTAKVQDFVIFPCLGM